MFDADQYLRDLIDHLVAGATRPGKGRTDSVRDQVEAAAAALEAAGVTVSGHVERWGDLADEALERGGLIRRVSLGTSREVRLGAEGGPVAPRREEPHLEFVRLVPVGREFALAGGERLVLLSLTLWNVMFEFSYAVLDSDDNKSWNPVDRRAEQRWEISDDEGMRYQVIRGGGGSSGRLHGMTARCAPAVRPTASRLRLALLKDEERLVLAEVPLP